MGIEEVVDVQISIQDAAVSRAGFGIGLIIGTSGKLVSRVQSFANQAAVLEVFDAADKEAKISGLYFGQDIRPTSVLIGKRDADEAQSNLVIITALQNDTIYTVTVTPENGSAIVLSITSDSDATRAEIVTALVTEFDNDPILSDPNTGISAASNGDDFNVNANNSGSPFTITVSVNLSVQTITPNKNISSELVLIDEANSDWYALMSDSHTSEDVKRAASFIQPKRKIYIAATQAADVISPEAHIVTLDYDADFVTGNLIDLDIDGIPVAQTPFNSDQSTTINDLATNILAHANIIDASVTGARQITIESKILDTLLVFTNIAVTGGASQANGSTTLIIDPTTDLGSELKALSLDRTGLLFSKNADSQFPEGAWVGGRLPLDAGAQSWFGKVLIGVTIDALTGTEKNKAHGNNVNTYTEIGGLGFTQNGTMASGRFIDVRRLVDALQADMEERIFAQIANLPKIPFTDAGIAIIENEIRGSLSSFQPDRIAIDPAFTVSVPKALAVSSVDRANRLLPDVTFDARLAGAIHKVVIRGTVSV